ncbi:MAG: hypothetical protein ACRDMV_05765 [Streptosporangiales bacterium]
MRLTAREVIRALTHHGFPVPSTATLRDWRRRGYISPGRGYDAAEVIALQRTRMTRRAA